MSLVNNKKAIPTMSSKQLAAYRLPIPSATRVGAVRIVTDRNGQHYADGSKIIETITSGIHTTIKLANGRSYYVLTKDYLQL
jgi:hypothetical protein